MTIQISMITDYTIMELEFQNITSNPSAKHGRTSF